MKKTFQYRINMWIGLGCMVMALCLLFFIGASNANAAEATFSWTPNAEPVDGYKIHYGTQPGVYDMVADQGTPAITDGSMIGSVDGLVEGQTYYFAATAYNQYEESGYSPEVAYTIPDRPVSLLKPTGFTFNKVVLYTTDGSKRITIDGNGTVIVEDM